MSDFNIHYFSPEGFEKKVLIIEFVGEISNENVHKFQGALDTLGQRKELSYIIFDFTKLEFINSQAIGYLLRLIRLSEDNKQKIILVGLSGQVAEVVELIGINRIIDICDNSGEAIDQLKEKTKFA